MGRSFTNSHIFNASGLTKPQFKKALTDMMKAKGYVKATEDDASVSFSLIFTKDRKWVTVLGEDINTSDLAKSLGLQVLSVELVDSDFAELKLHTTDGAADILMLGNPYMEEYPQPTPDKWQSILGESTWSQVEEIQSGDHTFAEDALAEFAQLIGLGENILLENDDIPEGADVMHFKKAKEKKLTLNAAFKQVFGGYLEPLGYKKLKGKNTYVKLVGDEVVLAVSCEKYHDSIVNPPIQTSYIQTHDKSQFMRQPRPDEEQFIQQIQIFCSVNTIYDEDMFFGRKSIVNLYHIINKYSIDRRFRNSIFSFSYLKDNDESLTASMMFMLDLAKEYFIPLFEKVTSYKDAVEFFVYYNSPFLKYDKYIKYGDYRTLFLEWLKYETERMKAVYENDPEYFENENVERDIISLTEDVHGFIKELDELKNDKKTVVEIMDTMEKNKINNTEYLKNML